MKIVHSSESFGSLKPNDTFRPIIGETKSGCAHQRGNLHMVIGDGGYPKAYDLEDCALLSYRKTTRVLRVRTELHVVQENF